MSNVVRKYGIFFIVPGIVLGCSIPIKLAAGPYWLSRSMDPSYVYLFSGLRILKGIIPFDRSHPGTPLQLLCAAVCWLFNIGRPVSDLATHVFISPEFYLQAVFVVLIVLSFVTSVGLAVYVFRKTGDRLAAILSQLPAVSLLVMGYVINRIAPELLFISVGNLFNICLLQRFFAKTPKGGYAATLFWGFVCGLGLAVKLTFIPLLAVPLIILSLRNRILFVGACMGSFILWTLPILSAYSEIWSLIAKILTHSGVRGSGAAGFLDIHSYWSNWRDIIVDKRLMMGLSFAALVLCFWKYARKKWEWGVSVLLVTTLGALFQFGIIAKHPGAHYLIPGFGLFSALLVLFYLQGPFHNILGQRSILAFILVFVLAGLWQAHEYRLKIAGEKKDILTFYEHIHQKYKGFAFIQLYPSSAPAQGLCFGDQYLRAWDELYQLYPDDFFYYWTWRHIINFKEKVLSNDLLVKYPGVIFVGEGSFDFTNTPFSVVLLEKGKFESVYLLTNTTEKQALMSHLAAVYFFQTGDIVKALKFNEQATALHYVP